MTDLNIHIINQIYRKDITFIALTVFVLRQPALKYRFLTWSEIVNLTAVTTVLLAKADSEFR